MSGEDLSIILNPAAQKGCSDTLNRTEIAGGSNS